MSNPRIQLREHAIEDMEPFCELQMDHDVAQFVSWLPRTRKQSEKALLDAIDQQTVAERTRYFFAVTLLGKEEMIGSVGFTMMGMSTADCGWFLRRRFWGKGYGSEAVRLMLSLALRDGRIERLTASCLRSNLSSVRLASSCGFRLSSQTLERAHFEIVTELANR